jgi:VanZ family protein
MFQGKATGFKNSAATLGLLTLAVIALLLAPLPLDAAQSRWPALVYETENLCHALVMALLAHATFRLLRLRQPAPARSPYAIVLTLAAAFGLATEIVQRFVGRDSSWIDVGNDVLGASLVLLLHARREYGSRLAGLAAVATALLATGPFLWTLAAYAHRSVQAPVVWSSDSRLFQRFSEWREGMYPGLTINEPLIDWSSYRTLAVTLRNKRDVASPVTLRVHDGPHNNAHTDRYNRTFALPATSTQTLHIPLDEIRLAPRGREMDMRAIRGVMLFQAAANQPPFFSVDSIRLER